jgi:hypothetical protein
MTPFNWFQLMIVIGVLACGILALSDKGVW